MVQFPSFHTALALLTAYAVRDVPYLARPVLILNLIVIVATLPVGGHHLADIIGGAAITGAAILVLKLHQSGWSPSAFSLRRGFNRRSLPERTLRAEPEA